MVADILNYTGNADLAGQTQMSMDLTPALNSFKDYNHRRNAVADMEYRQKIADRDTTFKAIATMQGDLDKVLPEDREILKKNIQEVTDLLMQPGVFEDSRKMGEVQKKMLDFNEKNAYAKTNYKSVAQETMEAAKVEDPEIRANMLKHIQSQREKIKASPFEMYDPYKKDLTVDFESLLPKGEVKSKILSSEGFNDTQMEYVDPESLVTKFDNQMLDPMGATTRNKYNQILGTWLNENRPAPERAKEMISWNEKIRQANEFITDEKLKIKEIPNYIVNGFNQGGKPEFDENFSERDLLKSMVIANRFNQTEAKTVYNEGRAKAAKSEAEILESNQDIKTKKAQESKFYSDAQSNRIRAQAYADHQSAITTNVGSETDVRPVMETYINKLVPNGKISDTKGNVENSGFLWTNELPEGFKSINGIVTDDKGKQQAGALKPLVDKKGREYYKVGYFDVNTGEKYDLSDPQWQEKYKERVYLMKKRNGTSFSQYTFNDYLKELMKRNLIGTEFVGKNGTANIYSVAQSMKLTNSKGGGNGKGKENLINQDQEND